MTRRVEVALGERSYTIAIGEGLTEALIAFVRRAGYSPRGMLVTDTDVGPLYAERIAECIASAGVAAEIVMIPAGESSKTLDEANRLFTRAIELSLDRQSPIFALGGGVVGDLTGFVAATYMRGVPFVQLPTSLLAQVDSSVGGKVAVNHPLGKNLIGAFYQPDAVFADLDLLRTLPQREIATGLGEIIKYGIICDSEFFAWLEQNRTDVLSLAPAAAAHVIARSCEIKADVVRRDERISEQMGLLRREDRLRIERLIEAMGLPLRANGVTVDGMYADLFHDKKTVGGHIHWVLAEGIGRVSVRSDVPEEIVRRALAGLCR